MSQGIPAELVCAADYERLALLRLPPEIAAWLAGGSGEELSLRDNRAAFMRVGLRNRLCKTPVTVNTAQEILGQRFAHPLMLAPVASHALVHPQGEIATAQGAEAMRTPLVLSCQASTALEQVAAHVSQRWLQLYWQQSEERTLRLVRRAEDAAYSALVLTLDAPVQAQSRSAQRYGFQLPAQLRYANLEPSLSRPSRAEQSTINALLQEAATMASVAFLLKNTPLPVFVKGVLEPADALELRELGVHGLIVSNHGGRALDGVCASLDALPLIRQAVGEQMPVLFDGGVRSGYDVFKALALGADAVLLGRLQLYALTVAGSVGVAHMLKILLEELELCMALSGCATLSDIGLQQIRALEVG